MSQAPLLAPDTPRRPRARPTRPPPASQLGQSSGSTSISAAQAERVQSLIAPPQSSLVRTRPGVKREQEAARRDDDLAVIIDEIAVGPQQFSPPPGDLRFETLEPYSGIRLRNRTLPYGHVQRIMEGRRFVSVSMLYALVQQWHSPAYNKTDWRTDGAYTLPFDSDWVIIGVLAEKSSIRTTKGGKGNNKGSDDENDSDPARTGLQADRKPKFSKDKATDDSNMPSRNPSRKYLAWKLVDYGNMASAPGGDGRTRGTDSGDCVLSLQLFAADEEPEAPRPDESKNHVREEVRAGMPSAPTRVYRGGSRGAFEKFWKEREGTVVAIVNPRIMRRGTLNSVNYDKTLLSITPQDAASIHVIGRATDHAQCQAHRKDGTRCSAWVDARTGTGICDYHLEQGVTTARRSRQEFAVGTSGGPNSAYGRHNTSNDADDIFTIRSQKRGRGGWKKKNGRYDPEASQTPDWNQSLEQGMDAGFSATSFSSSHKRKFVVEGTGTWIERGGRIQADGSGPKVGDINFDISEAYGRQKEEKKERLRNAAATSQLEESIRRKASELTPRPPPEERNNDDDDEDEGKDWMLLGTTTAAQALREAKRVLSYKQELVAAANEQKAKSRKSRLFRTNEDALLAAAMTKNAKERFRADDGTAPSKRPRWAYSAEAIQKMGFDPIAGSAGRAGAVPVWKENEQPEQGSKNKLLARVSGPTTNLPDPDMRKKRRTSAR